jgi:hypothetical protein
VSVATWAAPGWPQDTAERDIAGKYLRVGSASVNLEIERGLRGIKAVVSGGGPPRPSGAAAADCIIVAAGVIRDGQLRAIFQPIETDNFSYSHAKADAEKRELIVDFSPGVADIKRADTLGYCGLGIDFLGTYRRMR